MAEVSSSSSAIQTNTFIKPLHSERAMILDEVVLLWVQ